MLTIYNKKDLEHKYKEILNSFRANGGRITKSREDIIHFILYNPDSTCKEILYHITKMNRKIGRATIYRTIASLDEMGYIKRNTINIQE